ncbi:hypothetical protein ABZ235_23470 [Streptomyces canus]|uniref:hypothetical protein n=1 Tax=Streptomyces canus TaxID=58343 RepID=UPI0033A7486C
MAPTTSVDPAPLMQYSGSKREPLRQAVHLRLALGRQIAGVGAAGQPQGRADTSPVVTLAA